MQTCSHICISFVQNIDNELTVSHFSHTLCSERKQLVPFLKYIPSQATLLCPFAGALPIVHISLLCQPLARRSAMFGYVLFSCRSVRDTLTARSSARRLRSFALQALFRAFLFFLRWFKLGTGNPDSLRLYVIMDLLALMGGLVNVWRVPERFSPGTFDYWFNSHQIMHIAVVLAIMFLHWGTMEDLTWLKDYQCSAK